MSTQPNQGKNPEQDRYYAGYQPRKPADDPYGAYYQPSGKQQDGKTEAAGTGKPQSDPNYVYGQQQQQGQTYRSSSASAGQQQQQRSRTYEPPSSVTGKRYSSSGQTARHLEPRQAAALSYLGICFTGVFFLFWERQNRLVRFSAAQSVVLFLPFLVISGILKAIIALIGPIWLIGWVIGGLLSLVLTLMGLAAVVLWLFLMFQAYRGNEVKLPYVGDYAEKLLSRLSPKQKRGGY